MTSKESTSKRTLKRSFRRPEEAEALFMSMGDGAITTDEFGRISRVNPTALQIFGYKESEIVGKPFISVMTSETTLDGKTVALIDRPITQAYLTGKPVSDKLYYFNKQGRKIPLAINISPILLDEKPVGAIAVFRDISMELEIDQMKSDFISLASHQLRTPLSAIKTYTHILADGYMGELNSSQKKTLKTIIGASNRMNQLISTLLNITRIESGTIAVNLKSVKVDDLIRELLPELELLANDKQIDLQLIVAGKYPTQIKTDSLIVKEVLTNLVSNSIKYTPEKGKVEIIVKARKADIQVEVKDNGWGIPPQSHDKVFSKFFRGPNVIKRETSGTGLGLYLVKGLVESLNGKIWFESEEGSGTSFFFTLPRGLKGNPRKLLGQYNISK
ncbi:MAG TPA: ATP-binding protein [Candidatus Saccharimonadales bacterium]|nr:ATP-binding protein [Candidatus Saccharimonadales bacterium]